jgi:hypothetical protein
MRYINKEYGFAFRPPYFEKFHEEKKEGPALTDANFPLRYIFGAGYDYSAVNGAMLIGKYGSMWGVRVSCLSGKKWLDHDSFIHNMNASSAATPDNSFAHFAAGKLSAKWVKYGERGLILQLSARKRLRVRVIFYPCYGFGGELSIDGGVVKGRCPHIGVIPGSITLGENGAVFENRKLVLCDGDPAKMEYFFAKSYSKPSDSANGAFNENIMEFFLSDKRPGVFIYAAIGDETVFDGEIPSKETVINEIKTQELKYGVNKTIGSGVLGAPAERMLNSVLWSRVYYPYLLTEIYSPTRTLLNKHFDIKGAEENCGAILGALTGIDKAAYQLRFTLEDKILALFGVWNVYAHSTDKSGMLALFKQLSRLYPPSADLFESSDEEKAYVAYRWNDSPLKEKENTAAAFSLDLSCLKLLAFDILERISAMFSLPERGKYEAAHNELKAKINEVLWDGERGIYASRYVEGGFFKAIGATSFYPLIAGAVDSPDKLIKLVNRLTDPKEFFGSYIIPTLSASDPEYGVKGKPDEKNFRARAYMEYRGSIVPYVNYLIYEGLVRYGLDEIAGIIAYRSSKLWANNESDNVENYSLYLPNGKRYKAKEYFSSSGNMLAMIGLSELIDLEYFRPDLKTNSIRFGTFCEGDHSVSNWKLLKKTYGVEVRGDTTELLIEGKTVFIGTGGRCKVRNFIETRTGAEFMIHASAAMTLNLLINSVRYGINIGAGRWRITAGNGDITANKIRTHDGA